MNNKNVTGLIDVDTESPDVRDTITQSVDDVTDVFPDCDVRVYKEDDGMEYERHVLELRANPTTVAEYRHIKTKLRTTVRENEVGDVMLYTRVKLEQP